MERCACITPGKTDAMSAGLMVTDSARGALDASSSSSMRTACIAPAGTTNASPGASLAIRSFSETATTQSLA